MNQSNLTRLFQRLPATCSLLPIGLLCLAACRSKPDFIDPALGKIERASAAAYLAEARANLDSGDLLRAVAILIEVRKTRGLIPEDLNQADHLLNEGADKLFARVEAEGGGSARMRELYELELPTRLRAIAGLREAEQLFQEGHPVLAYRKVSEVENKLPNHPMRDLAAEILWRTGTYMLGEEGNYNLFSSYKVKGAAALEFLVARYASSAHCAQSYALLAHYYESIDDDDLALERWENLLIYHAGDELVPEASARMPYLRMKRLRRNDYDRTELLRAKQEIERWLSFYPDLEQASWMRNNLNQCLERLALNDLTVARFYIQVDSPIGARLHADRALIEAKGSGSAETIAKVQALLAKLPAEEAVSFGVDSASEGAETGTN